MKNILMITFAFSFALLTGCGGFYGRGGMYGGTPYGMPNAMNNMAGTPMMGGPMMGSSMMGTGLPVGARGRMSPYGGSAYTGTAYANPEVVAAADRARRAWRDGSGGGVIAPATPAVPAAAPATTSTPDLESRVTALEEQALADHLPE